MNEDRPHPVARLELPRTTASLAQATALSYRPGDAAPRVVARGRGLVADEIVRRAIEAGVPRVESEALVNALLRVELDAAIPPELYLAVAEVLAWVYRIDADARHTPTKEPARG